MKKIAIAFVVLSMLVATLACDAPLSRRATQKPTEIFAARPDAGASATATESRPPTATPTLTPIPTETPTPTPSVTPTPAAPWVSPLGGDILCYFGPGTEFAVDGGLLEGEQVPVLGRDEVALWLQIENPRRPGKHCWVTMDDVLLEGDAFLAPVLPPPLSIVTAVTVELKPKTITATGCVFPVTFDVKIAIQVTGPTTVTFTRSQSTGLTAPSESITLSAAGTWTGGDYLRVGSEGEHWFAVQVTSPNGITGTGYGKVVCP